LGSNSDSQIWQCQIINDRLVFWCYVMITSSQSQQNSLFLIFLILNCFHSSWNLQFIVVGLAMWCQCSISPWSGSDLVCMHSAQSGHISVFATACAGAREGCKSRPQDTGRVSGCQPSKPRGRTAAESESAAERPGLSPSHWVIKDLSASETSLRAPGWPGLSLTSPVELSQRSQGPPGPGIRALPDCWRALPAG
jgi:hypothetical protein